MNYDKIIDELIKKNGRINLSKVTPEQIEMSKDYISTLDLSKIVFDGLNVAKFNEINDSVKLVQFLTSKKKINDLSEEYVSHYTNYEIAKKIILGKKIQLGNPANMNDGLEFNSPQMDCSKMYFASFSI